MRKRFANVIFAGVFLLFANSSFATLVTNGGFESDLTGWTCSAPGGSCGAGTFAGPQEGAKHFWGFDNGPGGLNSQAFATTIGAMYSIDFFYGSSAASPVNNLSLVVGDLSQSFTFASSGWSTYSATFSAVAAFTDLQFFFDTDSGSGTLWLDGIVVKGISSVPEPSSLALLLLGFAGVVFLRRRKAL
jgi:hypothetical protein